MGAANPELAVRKKLGGPLGRWEPGGQSEAGWQAGIVHGGNAEQADLDTIRFVKHRSSKSRHLYFVTFEGNAPALGSRILRFHYVYAVEPDPDGGWRVCGSAGGAGEPPQRGTPSVNLGGGGWPSQFFAGGWIERAGSELERIELRFDNGITLKDDCVEGCALFITDQSVQMPGTIAMLDSEGNEIATHPAFPGV
jgi:hypothetical protein